MAGQQKKVGDIAEPDEGVFAVSKVKQSTFIFSWDIDNFSKIQDKRVRSPVFQADSDEWGWYIVVETKNKKNRLEYLGAYLQLYPNEEDDDDSVTADYQISLVNSDRRILKTFGEVRKFTSPDGWGLAYWIARSDMTEKGFLTDDILKLHCRITTNSKLNHEQSDHHNIDSKSKRKNRHLNIVKKKIESFLTSGEFTDITLKTQSGSFPGTKIVLAAHSPVFHAMFNSGMLESQKNVVKIEDFSDEIVKEMLKFMYFGHVDSLQDNAMELLRIADKYQIDGLKIICEEFLVEELNIENAAETLILADLHSALCLKQKVISFITRNKKAVQRTDGFILMKEHHKAIFVDLYIAMNDSP